jgi:hypothetical protein
MGLYVYGTLPVYIVKWTAILLDKNNYDQITFVGRNLSALFDIAALLFLFLIAKRLYGKKVGLLAVALMAFSVLNIQLSRTSIRWIRLPTCLSSGHFTSSCDRMKAAGGSITS